MVRRIFLEAEPTRGIAQVDRDPAFGTDRLSSALVGFGSGRHLDFTVGTGRRAVARSVL